jgi:hypothetical protein
MLVLRDFARCLGALLQDQLKVVGCECRVDAVPSEQLLVSKFATSVFIMRVLHDRLACSTSAGKEHALGGRA